MPPLRAHRQYARTGARVGRKGMGKTFAFWHTCPMTWLILILIFMGINLLLILANPMARFWRFAGRRPEEVLERMRASEAWMVFETGLPADFRSSWPKEQWVGPFRIDLKEPRRQVLLLGRNPGYKESAARIMSQLAGGPAGD